jgi:hypothetical protein
MRRNLAQLAGAIGLVAALAMPMASEATAATTVRTCQFSAPGQACIFDVQATGAGTLTVCTKAQAGGERWRSTVVETLAKGAVSDVGTGSASSCTGTVSRDVARGSSYEAIVSYERPLPGTFPTAVEVRLTGPVTVVGPRRPGEEIQSCRQANESGRADAVVDVEAIGCGTLMMCGIGRVVGDTDTFTFSVPAGAAVAVTTARRAGKGSPCWELFDPSGASVSYSCYQRSSSLSRPGKHTIQVYESSNDETVDYTLSLQGISQAYSCGIGLTYGALETGRIEIVGDVDSFNFDGVQGAAVSITPAKRAGSGSPCWELFDPSGASVSYSCYQRAASLPKTGRYTIKVYESSNDETVDYTLSLQRVGGALAGRP